MSVLMIKNQSDEWVGIDTIQGKTPQKGVDYFTESDINEISTIVKQDIAQNGLTIGNTTITEEQLIQLLALFN